MGQTKSLFPLISGRPSPPTIRAKMLPYADYLYPLGEGVTALVVMATDLEYGAHLKALGIKPLITGLVPCRLQ